MDAFRLLSCSTNLKAQRNQLKRDIRPSEESNEYTGGTPPSRKRKRNSIIGLPSKQITNDAPPNFGHDHPNGDLSGIIGEEDVSDREPAGRVISETQRRSLLKRHNIKITDLRKLHKVEDGSTTKKNVKEAARIFPEVLTSFKSLPTAYMVNNALVDNIADLGYYEPTEVQLACIPLVLGQQRPEPDLLTIAPTGSGKTLAFLLPLIHNICQLHRQSAATAKSRHVSAIIMAPTKELVGQIVNEGRKLTHRTGVTITAMKKGMQLQESSVSNPDQHNQDSSGDDEWPTRSHSSTLVKCDILVSTPLSFLNAILSTSSSKPTPLPNITSLILDEADVLLDQLFRDQTLNIWSACTNQSLRVSLWSATIGSNIESLALDYIDTRRKLLKIPKSERASLIRVVVGLKDSALPSSITHKLIYAATEPGKLLGLRQLLHPPSSHLSAYNQKPGSRTKNGPLRSLDVPLRPPFLVFTQTISRATALHHELLYDLPTPPSTDPGDSRIAVLHSDLSDSHRSDIMARFRKGNVWILITTDLLSRGVDFHGVNVVVNYDIPNTSAAYVHRAGRTGRQTGSQGRRAGTCVTFYTKEDIKYVRNIANVISQSQKAAGAQSSNVASLNTGLEPWLLSALPSVSRKDRKELKERGVEARRPPRENESQDVAKLKRKARIGTLSGYDKKVQNNTRGAVEGSLRRQRKDVDSDGDAGGDEWGGISD